MFVHESIIKIPAQVQRVFDFITTNTNFPKWKKDVWPTGKTMGTGEGSKANIPWPHLSFPAIL